MALSQKRKRDGKDEPRKKRKINSYNDDIESDTKKMNNKKFVNRIIKSFGDGYKNIIILDGKNMRTTKMLNKYGININNSLIHVPEMNYDTHKIHKKSGKCLAFHGTLENYLNHLTQKNNISTVNAVYFDFEGHIEGNKQKNIYPLENINLFLKNSQQEKIVIGITVSVRGKEKFKGRKKVIEQIVFDFIQKVFNFNQYQIKNRTIKNKIDKKIEYTYCKSSKSSRMIFLLYELVKDLNIDVSSIEFPYENDYFLGFRNCKVENSLKCF